MRRGQGFLARRGQVPEASDEGRAAWVIGLFVAVRSQAFTAVT